MYGFVVVLVFCDGQFFFVCFDLVGDRVEDFCLRGGGRLVL